MPLCNETFLHFGGSKVCFVIDLLFGAALLVVVYPSSSVGFGLFGVGAPSMK